MPLRIASGKQGVLWNGSFFVHHSLALVNRELTLALLQNEAFSSRFDLGIEHYETPTFEAKADDRFAPLAMRLNVVPDDLRVTVRHRWPPEFAGPKSGKLVLIQPWEFGSLPRQWVHSIAQTVDEMWVPSSFVRETYVTSGVPSEKVVVVPNGVNLDRFHPNVAPYDFSANPKTQHLTPDTYKFLFVGGTIARKGIDILLDAYDRAFTARDDVALIIKDFGTNSFYADQGMSALIRALQVKPGGAKIIYLTKDLSETEIASLYAACDCLVHPYRGEGYGLPIAEAMACAKPTILTGFGAALDFADETNAYLIPGTRERLAEKHISGMETVDFPYWAKPDTEALRALLKRVVENREEAAAKGAKAAADIAAKHTWADAARVAAERFISLADGAKTQATETAAVLPFALPKGLENLGATGLRVNTGFQVLGTTGNAVPGMQVVGQDYEDRKQAALQEIRAQRWKTSSDDLEACLIERPDDWDLVNALAVSLFRQGNLEGALELLHRGLASAPNARDFHHNLAFVLLETGQPQEALEHALSALETTPDNPEIRRTVERTGEAVLKLARKVLRRYPDKQRAQAKRDPEYRALMETYERAQEALKGVGCRVWGVGGNSTTQLPNYPITQLPNAQHPRLSLCMIVKNEERFLRNCLESAKGVVDEIVIVDTGSTDSTLDIAREYGAIIVEHPWNDDFSEARNVSLRHATGNWALWLDADEEIAPESKETFREMIAKAPREIGGYLVMFRNWLSSTTRDEKGEMAVHHACRLFRLEPGVMFVGRIHEQNLPSLQGLGYTHSIGAGLVIDHFGYSGEIMTQRNKHERFIRMLHREVEECPIEGFRGFHLFNLGNAYFTFGDMENAALYLGQASQTPDVTEEYTTSLFGELATSLHRLGRSQEGIEACERADALGLQHSAIDFAGGYCLLSLERYTESEESFRAAIQRGVEDNRAYAKTGDTGASGFKALYGLGLALVGQERYEEAVIECDKAIAEKPGFAEARYLRAVALARSARPADARRELETLLTMVPQHEDALKDLVALLWVEQDYTAALPPLRQLMESKPFDYQTVARYATCCDTLGLLDEARIAYERLRMLAPGSAEICVNLGRVLAASGAEGEAIDCFADSIRMNPRYANAYFNAGDVLYRLGVYDRAADIYIAGLEVQPENPSGFFMLGNCYFQTRAYSAAVLSYQQTLTLDPAHNEARNNLELAEEQVAKAA